MLTPSNIGQTPSFNVRCARQAGVSVVSSALSVTATCVRRADLFVRRSPLPIVVFQLQVSPAIGVRLGLRKSSKRNPRFGLSTLANFLLSHANF
jgi:hypothetical protein